jgi:hypothetical protein
LLVAVVVNKVEIAVKAVAVAALVAIKLLALMYQLVPH